MNARPMVAYFRVSTRQQERSGLGLLAQRDAVQRFVQSSGGALIGEFTEIESGRHRDRPKIAEALWMCRVYDARLVIARLDRLSRNTALIAKLMETGVDFVAADMPLANNLTLHLLAAVAEYEVKLMSQRIKGALAVAKARGATLGVRKGMANRKHLALGTAASNAARAERLKARAKDFTPLLRELRDAGQHMKGIAARLTEMGFVPPRGGKKWHSNVVQRMFEAAGEQPPERRGNLRRAEPLP